MEFSGSALRLPNRLKILETPEVTQAESGSRSSPCFGESVHRRRCVNESVHETIADYLASRYAVLKDRIQTQYTGKKLDQKIDYNRERIADKS